MKKTLMMVLLIVVVSGVLSYVRISTTHGAFLDTCVGCKFSEKISGDNECLEDTAECDDFQKWNTVKIYFQNPYTGAYYTITVEDGCTSESAAWREECPGEAWTKMDVNSGLSDPGWRTGSKDCDSTSKGGACDPDDGWWGSDICQRLDDGEDMACGTTKPWATWQ